MKILFLGDYSNLHACLAKELRGRGHEVMLISDRGSYMQTDADVELRRKPGMYGAISYLWEIMASLPAWKGYDVVQLINPGFLSLKPGKLRIIFDILKKNNRSVFLTLCGNDHYFVKDCVEGDIFRFSEFRIGKEKTDMVRNNPWKEDGWLIPEQERYTKHVYDHIDGAMAVLPEYYMSACVHMDPEKVIFTNIPVELDSLPYSPLEISKPVRVLVGMKPEMTEQKGTQKLLETCRQIESEHEGKVTVDVASGLSLADYLNRLKESHVVIDQLYSYSPATNALQTMALGRVAATGWQPECAALVGRDSAPVITLAPDMDIKTQLESALLDSKRLLKLSCEGRSYVEKENDIRTIVGKFEKHWNNAVS